MVACAVNHVPRRTGNTYLRWRRVRHPSDLLMFDTLDHVESTIRPNRILAFPRVTVR